MSSSRYVNCYARVVSISQSLQTDDVLKLLGTNGGDYAAACSLDFSKPSQYYDTFALRDTNGQAHAMPTWPYFKGSVSRNALVNHLDAVPVASCWNGIGLFSYA